MRARPMDSTPCPVCPGAQENGVCAAATMARRATREVRGVRGAAGSGLCFIMAGAHHFVAQSLQSVAVRGAVATVL